MSTWTAQRTAKAAPAAVLDVRTDPGACGRWAPVDFEVRPAGRGLAGRMLAHATSALLAGGALQTAVASIAREAEASAVAL